MSTMVADTRAVFQREMSLVLRDPFSVIFPWFSRWSSLACSARCWPARWIRPR